MKFEEFIKKFPFINEKICFPEQRREFTENNTPVFSKLFINFLGKNILFKKEHLKKNKNPETLNILFALYGGFGDFLINANFIYYFAKYIGKDKNIKIDVCSKKCDFEHCNGVLQSGINGVDDIFLYDSYDKSTGYDIVFTMCTFVYTSYCNIKKINKINKKLYNLLMVHKAFKKNHQGRFLTAANMYKTAIANNKSMLQLSDVGELLGIKKDFDFPVPYPENEDEILEKFGLKDRIFITFNRGICKNDAAAEGTKMWSYDKTNELVKLIKEKYPEITLVQTGVSKDRCRLLNNIDINLIEKTDFDDIKVLIKNSFLHIDCEGGFAHLRNALKAKHPAIVLFGPTNPDLYGYDTNINIRKKEACPIYCDWVTAKWQTECLRDDGGIPAPCMEAITIKEVFDTVDNYIKNNLIDINRRI